jgi:hypothetical protein
MGDDGEVEITALHPVDEVRRRLADHGHLRPGVRAGEAGQDLGQVTVRIVVRQAETDAPGEVGFREGCDALELQPHDSPCVVEQALAVLRQPGGAPIALEDRPADPLLQALHLHGHRGLGLVNRVRGAGEGPSVDDGNEGPELVDVEEVHGRAPIRARDATHLNHSLQE